MLCEMIGGYNPFTAATIKTTFDNIVTLNINWPKNISQSAKVLLQKIFIVDPNERATIEQIKNDKYFKGIDWEDIDSCLPDNLKATLKKQLSDI